jgi:hypothetical protein
MSGHAVLWRKCHKRKIEADPSFVDMPHSFKPHPKHPAVPFLVRLHADIGGRILENKRQADKLVADAKAVEAVLRMFDPEFNARAISARRRVIGNPWFKRGTLFRHALDVLRTATAPMSVTEIAAAMLTAKGVEPTRKQRLGIEAGVRCSLENNAGRAVERVGEGVPKRWELAS